MMVAMAIWFALQPPVHLGDSRPRDFRSTPQVRAATPSLYPIVTPQLRVGVRNPRRIAPRTLLGRPLCVIGSDQRSIVWLRTNAETLRRVGALCYVVNIESAATSDQLHAIAPGVPMAAINGAVFAIAGLRGYPALILQNGVVR